MEYQGVRITAFLSGLLAVFALCGFLLPEARIELIPPQVEQSIQIPVLAGEGISHVSPAGLLPLKMTRFIVEGHDSIPASGWTNVPDQYAAGDVQFSNLTDLAVDIPSGTVVMAVEPEKIRFVTTREGKLAAGVNTTTDIPIRAIVPGAQGNLPANAIHAVEGPLGLKVSVANAGPTGNGSDRRVRSPDAADHGWLRSKLMETLTAQARENIRARSGEPAAIVETTLAVHEILEEEFSPPIGYPADVLDLSLGVEFQALFIEESDLQALARMALDANLPGSFQPADGLIRIEPVEEFHLDIEGRLLGQIHASRWLVSPIQASQVADQVKGKPVETALGDLISAYALEQPPKVLLFPRWWPIMPFFDRRIDVTNQNG